IGLDRRINVLVYLNKSWKDEYGGHFELWDRDMKNCVNKVPPTYNTMAIFSTTDFSYHGHPDPLQCPQDMSRKSLALYYYSNGRPAEEISLEKHTTLFQQRTDNKADGKASSKNKRFLKKIL
ncbi:MAG: 2OG-Fe(II) oxygenase, partial [Rhabdochlamydiaceae bacterium]